MPAPQWTPPGHLDWHVVLVAATPAALALAAGCVARLAGGGRAARALGWVSMVGALALLAAFLRPHGVAAAYTEPLIHGWLRVGPWQAAAALAASLWVAWNWRPGPERGCVGWGARSALAMLLPVLVLPVLVLACEPDLRPRSGVGARARPWRLGIVLLATALACWLVPVFGAGSWWARLPMAVACAAAACAGGVGWAPPLVVAAVVALLPLAGE